MTSREDDGDRLRALTQLDSTLLVEAAAGTGKTSLLAGRVVMLLAGGAAPRRSPSPSSRPASSANASPTTSTPCSPRPFRTNCGYAFRRN